MKKLFTLATTVAVISAPSVFAHHSTTNNQPMYVKLSAGVNKMNKVNSTFSLAITGANPQTASSKIGGNTNIAPVINLAVGYQVVDNIRLELEGGYIAGLKTKETDLTDAISTIAGGPIPIEIGRIKAHTKSKIWTIAASGYWDFMEVNGFLPFVGLGVGIAFVKDEVAVALKNSQIVTMTGDVSWTGKRKLNFTPYAIVGGSKQITDHVAVELAYRFQYYGAGKPQQISIKPDATTEVDVKTKSNKHRGHSLTFGLRVAI